MPGGRYHEKARKSKDTDYYNLEIQGAHGIPPLLTVYGYDGNGNDAFVSMPLTKRDAEWLIRVLQEAINSEPPGTSMPKS